MAFKLHITPGIVLHDRMSDLDLVGWCLGPHVLQSGSPEMFVPVLRSHSVRLDHRSLAPEILSILYNSTIILTGSHCDGL